MKPSVLVLLEPAFDRSTYESKYYPLMQKYLDSTLLDVGVVGSRNAVSVVREKFPATYNIQIYPKASRGLGMPLGYLSYLLFSFFALLRISRKNRYSILVSLGGHPYTGLSVSLAAKLSKKKSVIRISEPTRIITGNRYALGRLVSTCVGIAESVSFYFANLIITNRDMSWYHKRVESKQVILSQGVDVERFSSNVLATLNSDNYPRLITVARLDKQKNIKSVIEAVSLLKQKHPKLFYYIVGAGPDEVNLRALASKLGVNDQICFYSYASPKKIPGLLKSADFFVLPSLVEGLPSAVLEAMACGLPVILASTDYSCQDTFKDGDNSLIVTGDSKSIAKAVDLLIFDARLRSKIAVNGQNFVKTNHNSSNTRLRFANFVKRLVS